MLAEESVPKWQTGFVVAAIAFWVLIGGAQRIGGLASKIVPVKFVI
jgi:Na+/alanine symporter